MAMAAAVALPVKMLARHWASLPLKPGRGQQTDVVAQARNGDQRQRQSFDAEVGADAVRAEVPVILHVPLHPLWLV